MKRTRAFERLSVENFADDACRMVCFQEGRFFGSVTLFFCSSIGMLHVILGTDRQKSRANFLALRESFEHKHPDALVRVYDEDMFDAGALIEYVDGQPLFGGTFLVILDSVLGESETKDTLKKMWKDIAASEHLFLVYEEKLDAATKKTLEAIAEKVDVYDVLQKEYGALKGKSRVGDVSAVGGMCATFSTFDLADAIALREKKRAWTMLMRAKTCDIPAEEMHGTIFWQVKMMCLAKSAASAAEVGMKPFVFGKAKRGASNFTEKELQTLLGSLVHAYHDAHRGKEPLYDAVENTILSL
ncbi:MAG: hypothetical protein HGA67_01115 [Candidatus Yonathbacteria bacterium]|nr:hypothetical protein [Candidatus Yonathbacteria bacterium]